MMVHKIIAGSIEEAQAQTRDEVINFLMSGNSLDEDEQRVLIEGFLEAVEGKAKRTKKGDAEVTMLAAVIGFHLKAHKLEERTANNLMRLLIGIDEMQSSEDKDGKKKKKK